MILYEDDFVIAVAKPNNILVHHSQMARNQSDEQTLLELLFEKFEKNYYPMHRLDRKTSGIVLCAKEKRFVSKFQDLFVADAIQKVYYGVVRGFSPENGVIDSPVKGRDANVYKSALTHYKTLATKELPIAVQPFETSRYSLVKLLPKTGRMHQLRIHLNKINHPLIGDPKYGDRFHNRMFQSEFEISNLFLHAHSLTFVHPFLEKEIVVQCSFPRHWCQILEKFAWEIS
ncbi:pseudouridine synthase [Kordia algicida OT-1]|uniref:Pseudouridylate synthase, 23S RNA-specific n=1 Tax=Kordia algicida OT-1 TaxID=391587 RepID=A9E0L2_9FLAO|nr:pseudouridine synthase [Kordia algicida]EDP95887.1 pseudouridylate synthase, 23S RNA-specific [Kordia algicida OT-1]